MSRSPSPVWRRFFRSIAYAAAGLLFLGIGFVLLGPEAADDDGPADGGRETGALVELTRLSSIVENRASGNRLHLSFHVRLRGHEPADGFVFVVASNEDASPTIWAVWPPQRTVLPAAVGGHLRVEDVTTGHHVRLTGSWAPVNAVIEQPPGQPPFQKAVVYVLGAQGRTILTRAFPL